MLDTKTYTEQPLLRAGLQNFQGPSLLPRYNRFLTEKEFENLSRVGESQKDHDTATGKLRQGLDAVSDATLLQVYRLTMLQVYPWGNLSPYNQYKTIGRNPSRV